MSVNESSNADVTHQMTLVFANQPFTMASPKHGASNNCSTSNSHTDKRINLTNNQNSNHLQHEIDQHPHDFYESSAVTKVLTPSSPSTALNPRLFRSNILRENPASKPETPLNNNAMLNSKTTAACLSPNSTAAATTKTATTVNANNSSESSSSCCSSNLSSVYIKNYDTSGICEQNFCLCFTHSVDVLTFLLTLILGRAAHRWIFCARIFIAFLFDSSVSLLFSHYFTSEASLAREFVAIQIVLSFVISILAFLSVFYENSTALSTRISVAIAFPFLEIFKIFIRCSNNLFCREDQENLAQYLSHRPISSLFFAYVAKAGIFTSGAVTYIGNFALTFSNFTSSAAENTKESYYICIALCTFDLLRNAYQAIVAENNHTSRATRYSDTLFRSRNEQAEGQEFDEDYGDYANGAQSRTEAVTQAQVVSVKTTTQTKGVKTFQKDPSDKLLKQQRQQRGIEQNNQGNQQEHQAIPSDSMSTIEKSNQSNLKKIPSRKIHRKFVHYRGNSAAQSNGLSLSENDQPPGLEINNIISVEHSEHQVNLQINNNIAENNSNIQTAVAIAPCEEQIQIKVIENQLNPEGGDNQ